MLNVTVIKAYVHDGRLSVIPFHVTDEGKSRQSVKDREYLILTALVSPQIQNSKDGSAQRQQEKGIVMSAWCAERFPKEKISP
jgi:hypothetical protein